MFDQQRRVSIISNTVNRLVGEGGGKDVKRQGAR